MKGKWHVLLAPLALLLQLAPPAFIRAIAAMSYRTPPLLDEYYIWPLSILGIAAWAAIGFFLGAAAAYLLLRRSRLRTAIPLILLCCIPSLIGGSVYLLATFVFLTVV